jgi:hypothetical protein
LISHHILRPGYSLECIKAFRTNLFERNDPRFRSQVKPVSEFLQTHGPGK